MSSVKRREGDGVRRQKLYWEAIKERRENLQNSAGDIFRPRCRSDTCERKGEEEGLDGESLGQQNRSGPCNPAVLTHCQGLPGRMVIASAGNQAETGGDSSWGLSANCIP